MKRVTFANGIGFILVVMLMISAVQTVQIRMLLQQVERQKEGVSAISSQRQEILAAAGYFS